MKKIFISTMLAMLCTFAGAQVVIPVHEGESLLKKSTEKMMLNTSKTRLAPSAKAASLDGTTLWGYHLGGIEETAAIGIEAPATYYAGYFVPGDGILKGSSINGVNLPIYSATRMTNVSVWISEDLETDIVSQKVDAKNFTSNAYNAVALDEPYVIPETGVFVGVKFTITRVIDEGDGYPILCGGAPNKNSMILKFTSADGSEDWYDYSNDFGMSYAMQLFCSNLTLPERHAYFTSATSVTTLSGAEVSLPVTISSDGAEGVSSIDYVVEINGNKTSKHIDLSAPIAGGFGQIGSAVLSFTAPEAYGTYTANISIEKINGNTNDASGNVLPVINKVVTKIVDRRTVVEEFTGTGCGWCPRGWAGMELLKETKEKFIGIAFHQFNTSDPMYVPNYCDAYLLGISGAPGCAMDRKLLGIDPYYGSYYSIIDDFDYCNALLPDVDVTVTGTFNADNTAVDITANVEYLTEGEDYTVAYVLTADGLSGTSSAWAQGNYYAQYPSQGDPLIDQFCQGGTYGTSSVYLTFNDVMIGSSYSEDGITNLAPALDGEIKAGTTATGTYTVAMPTKTALKNAINNDEVYAVVLVIASDGTIANAARAKVTANDGNDATGIVNAAANAEETVRYNTAGQMISAPQKGLNIIKLSNGKTVKAIEK